MPLSDRERQILSEIESQLASEDPKFARSVRTAPASPDHIRLRYGVAGFVIGVLMLLAIVVHIAWAFAGFVVMLVSAITVLNQLKHLGEDRSDGLGGQLRGGITRYVEGRQRPDREDG